MRKRLCSVLLVTAAILASCSRPAPPAVTWQRVAPLPTDADLHGLASARGLTVAVGEGGTILTSVDSRTWTLQSTETTDDLYAAAAAPAGFVAVGEGTVLTSADGAKWTARAGASNKHLRAAACGPEVCVVVGEAGAAVTGKLTGKWAATSISTTENLNSVAYAGGRFVAVGDKGAAFASADGRAWTPFQLALPMINTKGFYNNLVAVLVTGDAWVIYGHGWNSFTFTSKDGEHWALQESSDEYTKLVAAGGGRILRLNFAEKQPQQSLISVDLGATWRAEVNNIGWQLMNALIWDGSQFLAAGPNGSIKASTDGVAWEQRSPQSQSTGGADVAYGAGRFVAVSNGDVATSPDGLTWTTQARPKEPLYFSSIARGPDKFVATGRGIYTSVDGLTWTAQKAPVSPPEAPVNRVVWGNGRYVALFGNQTLTSVDGVAWQIGSPVGKDLYLNGLVAGDGGYVAYRETITSTSEIFTSTDGLTWISQGTHPRLESMASGKGLYVAFTGSGSVITSPDGRQWKESQPPVREAMKVFFVDDRFIAMGSETVLTSVDGQKWSQAGLQPARHGINGMAFGIGRIVGVGGSGSIITAQVPLKQ